MQLKGPVHVPHAHMGRTIQRMHRAHVAHVLGGPMDQLLGPHHEGRDAPSHAPLASRPRAGQPLVQRALLATHLPAKVDKGAALLAQSALLEPTVRLSAPLPQTRPVSLAMLATSVGQATVRHVPAARQTTHQRGQALAFPVTSPNPS